MVSSVVLMGALFASRLDAHTLALTQQRQLPTDATPTLKARQAPVVGSFTQYPLRLAWGTTIHKAQGKTFDQVVIDFGRGAFASGQAYVALSRCRQLEGVVLRRPFKAENVMIDARVEAFLKRAAIQRHPSERG